ncbi:MAG TPA: hypothetical protein VFC02_00310 [Anaerolineales bacterium]|nr:hypothetical protein [Anaerolineales bacterium]
MPSETDGLWWVYTTTSAVSTQPGTRIVAIALDPATAKTWSGRIANR